MQTVLLSVLDCAFDKQSWHGANLMSAVRGVGEKTAARRLRGRKTIWEQLLHAAYWKHRVLRKLGATDPFPRPGSNWIAMPRERNAQHWKADVAMIRALQARLRSRVTSMRRSELADKQAWLIHGAAAHDLYHAGQIKLLRRMLPSR